MLFVGLFFTTELLKSPLWIKPTTVIGLFLHCALRLKYVWHLKDIFPAFGHVEIENIKKAKTKCDMDEEN